MKEKVLVKSNDFLAGYMYKTLEKDVVKALCVDKEEEFPVRKEISIPWAWCCRRISCIYDAANWRQAAEGVMLEVANMAMSELKHTFDYDGKKFDASIWVVPATKGWRSEVCFEIYQLPEVKEMTVAEVEAALGYKIKIVGDK